MRCPRPVERSILTGLIAGVSSQGISLVTLARCTFQGLGMTGQWPSFCIHHWLQHKPM